MHFLPLNWSSEIYWNSNDQHYSGLVHARPPMLIFNSPNWKDSFYPGKWPKLFDRTHLILKGVSLVTDVAGELQCSLSWCNNKRRTAKDPVSALERQVLWRLVSCESYRIWKGNHLVPKAIVLQFLYREGKRTLDWQSRSDYAVCSRVPPKPVLPGESECTWWRSSMCQSERGGRYKNQIIERRNVTIITGSGKCLLWVLLLTWIFLTVSRLT